MCDWATFLLPYDVDQYCNKENLMSFFNVHIINFIQHQADSLRFSLKIGHLFSFTSLRDSTSKVYHVKTRHVHVGLNSFLGMSVMQPQWRKGTYCTGVIWRQVLLAIVSEIHSQRVQCSQGPNPSALPYPKQTGVLALSFLDHHD